MTRRHEERYKRAMERIKAKNIELIRERVDAAIIGSPNKKLPEGFRENYIAHKLGQRRVKS